MNQRIPARSPLIAAPVACQQCGTILQPKVVMGRSGVEFIEYQCVNVEKGCSYRIESTNMMTGESRPLRTDGTEVKL